MVRIVRELQLAWDGSCQHMTFIHTNRTASRSPGCFTMLTVDCQQHERYHNQYR